MTERLSLWNGTKWSDRVPKKERDSILACRLVQNDGKEDRLVQNDKESELNTVGVRELKIKDFRELRYSNA